jgi:hypothetical protein
MLLAREIEYATKSMNPPPPLPRRVFETLLQLTHDVPNQGAFFRILQSLLFCISTAWRYDEKNTPPQLMDFFIETLFAAFPLLS